MNTKSNEVWEASPSSYKEGETEWEIIKKTLHHYDYEYVAEFLTQANAERIVACVNACEGIADPSVVPELLEYMKHYFDILERGGLTELGKETHAKLKAILSRAKGES